MDGTVQELRHAARRLMRSTAFTLAAVLTLALAIAANTSIFAVVERVVLNPLPYPDSDRLVELWGNVERQVVERRGLSVPDYIDYAEKSRSFSKIAAWENLNFIRYGSEAP